MAESRRERYDVHGDEGGRLRCLLCQQWIEADHDEALAHDRDRLSPGPGAPREPMSSPVQG